MPQPGAHNVGVSVETPEVGLWVWSRAGPGLGWGLRRLLGGKNKGKAAPLPTTGQTLHVKLKSNGKGKAAVATVDSAGGVQSAGQEFNAKRAINNNNKKGSSSGSSSSSSSSKLTPAAQGKASSSKTAVLNNLPANWGWKALASPYGNGGPDIRNAFAELQPQLAAKWPGSITHEEAAQGAQGDIGGGVKLKGYNGNTPRIEYQSSQIKISDLKGKPVMDSTGKQLSFRAIDYQYGTKSFARVQVPVGYQVPAKVVMAGLELSFGSGKTVGSAYNRPVAVLPPVNADGRSFKSFAKAGLASQADGDSAIPWTVVEAQVASDLSTGTGLADRQNNLVLFSSDPKQPIEMSDPDSNVWQESYKPGSSAIDGGMANPRQTPKAPPPCDRRRRSRSVRRLQQADTACGPNSGGGTPGGREGGQTGTTAPGDAPASSSDQQGGEQGGPSGMTNKKCRWVQYKRSNGSTGRRKRCTGSGSGGNSFFGR
ncbi:hypothetical protein CHLRE_10g431000v5 [Chlamydomonas reinhardtii]|uniref:Uncharacterized protein n=1 Tax=Chlamydomonas reinhardtii TaxID=3055 RepID=A0A2K3D9V5_CHLRE|nr:uncharacterized protein CHLRE_10g431000v5 [Chlamydomonas reinhardtii]PNW77312.1 hypothetical protein CHLRE_10g431000v5 [Chlamydomonas reinhardtii]